MKTFNFPSDFTPTFGHPEGKEWVYGRTVVPLAKLWMKYVQRLEVFIEHAERIPTDGPAMIAVNHTGYWDFVYGGIPAHFHGGRVLRYMAKKEIFDTPVAGQIMRGCRHIPVDRAAGAESAREAVRRLKAGELVGIFPEATISRSFEIKELREGAARIAREANAPLIPLILWGSQQLWTKGHKSVWRPKDAKIVMYVGEPVEVTADATATTERLHTAMKELLETARAAYVERFGEMPKGEYWVPASLGGTAPTLEDATVQDRRDAENRKKKRAEDNARRAVEEAKNRAELENASGVKKLFIQAKQRLCSMRNK
ncbi:lysophospholipid acyltransferase family protein [Corynebacterium urogenitale]